MNDENHGHDHWAEHIPDEELVLMYEKRQAEAILKEHELTLAQYRTDRLEREIARRSGSERPAERGPWRPLKRLPTTRWNPATVMPVQLDPVGTNANNCELCGLKLDQPMSYACAQPKCPTGLGSPTS